MIPGHERSGEEIVAEELSVDAAELRFEYAAKLRDEIKELRRELNALATA